MEYRQLAEEFLGILNERPRCLKHKKQRNADDAMRGEMGVLAFLREIHNPASPSELSNDRNLSTARVANTLASLERKGWIERVPDSVDRRKVLVYLTDKGMEEAEAGHQRWMTDMEDFLIWLGEEDAEAFVRLQGRMNEYMKMVELREED